MSETATTAQSAALLPCPCCGVAEVSISTVVYSDQTKRENEWPQNEFFGVCCPSCGLCNRGLVGHLTREAAAGAWNRRADPMAPVTLAGWKLVPITPTQGMLMAGIDRPQPDPADPRDHEWGGMYRAIYGAMLEASPPADRVVTALAQIDRALGRDNAAPNPLRRIDYPEGRFGPAMLDGGDEMTGRELQLIAKSHGFDLRLVVTEWDDEAAEILDRNGTFGEALEAEEPPQSIVGGYQLVGAWEGEEDGLVLAYARPLRADANPEGTATPGASS
jgi:hypothetical protein